MVLEKKKKLIVRCALREGVRRGEGMPDKMSSSGGDVQIAWSMC